jgi:dihydroorotate dehydrogenase
MLALLYDKVARPMLFALDAEQAHDIAMTGLNQLSAFPGLAKALFGGTRGAGQFHRPVQAFGLTFPNVIGLAAGFDKNAVALPAWEAMGFGFVEVGTITALAQPGNPKPRLHRFPEEGAIINRFGFNNQGADCVACRLKRLRRSGRWPKVPVGINIGKSKLAPIETAEEDYVYSFHRLFPFADYFVLNVSSPNTPGLRQLQGREELAKLLAAVQAANREKPSPKPVLVKIAPDLEWTQIEDVLALAEEHELAGIIATNTTIDHSPVQNAKNYKQQQGGLSGVPLAQRSTEVVKFVAEHSRLPVIAVGGISSGDEALKKLDAGATLLQAYTALVYRGPGLIKEVLTATAPRLGHVEDRAAAQAMVETPAHT